jgi:hypothetical protein
MKLLAPLIQLNLLQIAEDYILMEAWEGTVAAAGGNQEPYIHKSVLEDNRILHILV